MWFSGLSDCRGEHDCVFGVVASLCRAEVFDMATITKRACVPANVANLRRDAAALDVQLDLALAYTFPASDPVAVGDPTGTEPPRRPVDREAPAFNKNVATALDPHLNRR